MEHRWGIRRMLDVGVTLYAGSKLPRFGRLLNASASGAYVATSVSLPLMTRVHVTFGWSRFQRGGRHRIAAYVVRADARGIGVEWQEFAPLPVLALIEAPERPPSREGRHGHGNALEIPMRRMGIRITTEAARAAHAYHSKP